MKFDCTVNCIVLFPCWPPLAVGRLAKSLLITGLANSAIRALIREGKAPQMTAAIQMGKSQGMISMDETLTWELEGELIWNVAASHAESLTLEGTITREMERNQDMEGPMGSVSIVQSQVFEGDYKITIAVEAVEGKEGE